MTVRRVVTGHDAEGNSVLIDDSPVQPGVVDEFPGFEPHEIWAADGTATVPAAGPPIPTTTYFPPVNGVRFQVIVFPPETTSSAAVTERADRATQDPMMHTTDSVDYIYIASGAIVLALDNGTEVELQAGDTVVQQGVSHAWHNRSDTACVVIGTLVGAHRTD